MPYEVILVEQNSQRICHNELFCTLIISNLKMKTETFTFCD